ncbi:c-type cytochrome [Undibacterium griseum]|uniref:C-type cytochrome n=1 Tax=Undibacterium griseum TaxID=2762295 RepID=A0ABR6YJW8_9BURK|nr:c-type cytochrome [Undibacterium griseum]MBC3884113.1 c-type cytochrome [Undibacterium griseum]
MKKMFTLVVIAVSFSIPALAADEATAMDLAKKNNCLTCHSIDKKLVGPAWKDIGKKYAGDPAAAEQLALKVKKGTKSTWGPIPMPPNVTVKDADIKSMVEFILTLK